MDGDDRSDGEFITDGMMDVEREAFEEEEHADEGHPEEEEPLD